MENSSTIHVQVSDKKFKVEQAKVFLITALYYCSFHASRTSWAYSKHDIKLSIPYFDDYKLGALDMSFMLAYALGQFINGWLGDKSELRVFLSLGTVFSIIGFLGFTAFANLGIHMIGLFCFLFVVYGFGQSIGFPACTSVLGNWLEASKRGVLLGVWGACTDNLGNIIGQQLGSFYIDRYELDWSFLIITSSLFMTIAIAVMWRYIKLHPRDIDASMVEHGNKIGYQNNFEEQETSTKQISEPGSPALEMISKTRQETMKGISFLSALKTPGVIKYSLVNACMKGSSYGILLWLPDYLHSVMGFGKETAQIASIYEIGVLIGSISFGYITDHIGRRSTCVVVGLYSSAFLFMIIAFLGQAASHLTFLAILLFAGAFFGGPQVIASSVISFELANNNKEVRSISTIIGIINGSGSIVAALVQVIIPHLKSFSFYMYFGLCILAAILLTPSAIKDFQQEPIEEKPIKASTEDQTSPYDV